MMPTDTALQLVHAILAAAPAAGDPSVMPQQEMTAIGIFISTWAAPIGLAILLLGIVGCCYRIFKGPHLADRVLAGDTIAILVAGIVILFTMILENDLFFDAALVVAVIGFASTVAFSQYIGARRKFSPDPADTPAPASPPPPTEQPS